VEKSICLIAVQIDEIIPLRFDVFLRIADMLVLISR